MFQLWCLPVFITSLLYWLWLNRVYASINVNSWLWLHEKPVPFSQVLMGQKFKWLRKSIFFTFLHTYSILIVTWISLLLLLLIIAVALTGCLQENACDDIFVKMDETETDEVRCLTLILSHIRYSLSVTYQHCFETIWLITSKLFVEVCNFLW